MRVECLSVLLGSIALDRADLNEPVAVAAGQLSAVEIKLAVVDGLFVLRVERKDAGFLRHYQFMRN